MTSNHQAGYDLLLFNVIEMAQELASRPQLFDWLHWNFEEQLNSDGNRVVGEMWTTDWWKEEQAKIARTLAPGSQVNILCITFLPTKPMLLLVVAKCTQYTCFWATTTDGSRTEALVGR